jgi:spermidine/putrescine transport system permease protein
MKASLRLGPLVLTAPAVVGLLVFFIAPLVAFGVYSFLTGSLYDVKSPLTFDNYKEVFETDINRTLGRNSFVVGLLAATFSVLIALPMAYWLRYAAGRWRGLVLFLIVASFLASYLVRIFAWRSMLGRNGAINRGLESLGIIDNPLDFLLYNRFAVTVALVHIFLPYVVLVLYAGLAPLQPAYLETAEDLGAGRLQRWRRAPSCSCSSSPPRITSLPNSSAERTAACSGCRCRSRSSAPVTSRTARPSPSPCSPASSSATR